VSEPIALIAALLDKRSRAYLAVLLEVTLVEKPGFFRASCFLFSSIFVSVKGRELLEGSRPQRMTFPRGIEEEAFEAFHELIASS